MSRYLLLIGALMLAPLASYAQADAAAEQAKATNSEVLSPSAPQGPVWVVDASKSPHPLGPVWVVQHAKPAKPVG